MRLMMLFSVLLMVPVATAQQHRHHAHVASDSAGTPSGLSPDEAAGLLAGAGLGMARPAELNSYPGPLHVLDLAEALGLTDAQRAETEAIRQRMLEAARPLGARLVEIERHLDAAFASGDVSAESVERMTAHAASVRGQIRAAHLVAHVEMREVLAAEQVAAYDRLRGYR